MNKTKSLIISGSIIIGISFLLAIYFILIALGVIQTRTNKIIIQTSSLEVEYDGREHFSKDFKIIEGELLEGHEFEINYLGNQKDIGSTLNSASVKIIDDGLNDVTSNYELEVVYGTISVTKRKITFRSADKVEEYSGEYLVNTEYEILSGNLMEGDYFSGESTSSINIPGQIDNTYIIDIYNSDNKNVTYNYDITYYYGRLEIKKIPLTIASLSKVKVYDGKAIKFEEVEFLAGSNPFGHNHEFEVIFNIPEFSDVGQIENTFYLKITDRETKLDVTNMYDITYKYGTLTIISSIYDDPNITNKPLDYKSDTLISVTTNKNENIYLRDVSYGNYLRNKWGYATPQTLALFNNPANFVGKILTENNPSRTNLKLKFNRAQIPYLTPYFTTDNRGMNDIHNYGLFNNDKYEDYEVDYYNYNFLDDGFKNSDDPFLSRDINYYTSFVKENYLEIDPILKNRLLMIAYDNNINHSSHNLYLDIKEYIENVALFDTEFDEFPEDTDYVLYFLEHAISGISQHFASAAVLMYRAFNIPARYVTGYFSEGTINKEVSLNQYNAHAWVEIFVEGMGWVPVEVTNGFDKVEITIRPFDGEKVYDGLEFVLDKNSVDVVYGELLEGHYIEITTKERHVNATNQNDRTPNMHIDEYFIYDDDGNDVTNKYRVNTLGSRVNIHKKNIVVISGSYDFVYNGTEQFITTDYSFLIIDQLMGHYASDINFVSTIKDVGSTLNIVTFIILDEEGYDVTRNYQMLNNFGYLRVTPKVIEISGIDIIKKYSELVDGIFTVPEDAYLFVGNLPYADDLDKIIIKAKGSIDYVGSYQYEIEIDDQTKNYSFNIINEGQLIVIP